MLKKRLMLVLWRVQQAQVVISIVFWSLTLTGVFYPYVSERLLDSAIGPERVAMGMILMFAVILVSVIVAGTLYDRFKFWHEQWEVQSERNPYAYGGKVPPVHIILFEAIIDPTPKNRQAAMSLIERNLDDENIRNAYNAIMMDLGYEGDR